MKELRQYQIEDINFLKTKASGACFNEQRTGKTPIALKTMEAKQCTKILIVAPNSCVLPWKDEYTEWLNKPCIACIGTREKQHKLIKAWTNGLVVSYDSIKATKKTPGLLQEILKEKPEAVIIDEAHKIKNPKSDVAKTIFKLSKIKHKLALTGTPAPNRGHEIWSILHFLFPKIFSSFWKFIDEYFKTEECYIHRNGQQNTYKRISDYKSKEKESELQYILTRFTTQRKRKELAQWNKDKQYLRIHLEPSTSQKECLGYLKQYYEIPNTDIICKSDLDRLIRYRQICTTPKLLGVNGESTKLEWMKSYLEDNDDIKALIFTKFKKAIPLIRDMIPPKYQVNTLCGEDSAFNREQKRKTFQNKELKQAVMIAQIDVCKEGLTFDDADVSIFIDKYPPVNDILQAEDRIIATTADNTKEHTIIELVLKNTYDEDLYRLLEEHKEEVDILNNFKEYIHN